MFTHSDRLRVAGVTAVLVLSWVMVESPGPGAPLAKAIEEFQAGAVIVAREDLDATSCGPLGKRPGIVFTELNEDGGMDYAVLLRLKDTGNETTRQRHVGRPAQFAFVMFLAEGGTFTAHLVRRYTDDVPSAVAIASQAPGIVRHRWTGSEVRLPHPGVLMSFCEKFATIYYLEGNRVRAIPVAGKP